MKHCEEHILAVHGAAARAHRGHSGKTAQQNENASTRGVANSGKDRYGALRGLGHGSCWNNAVLTREFQAGGPQGLS